MNNVSYQIKKTIEKYGLINPGDSVVVGFSGGPDSVTLLHSLYSMREELGIDKIAAVHINHMYRGKPAFDDEEFCRVFCLERDIIFRAYRYDINKMAAEMKMSSEETGRLVRYGKFREIAAELGGARIAVAHNRNDQAETLLMRLARGTGTEGLCGIEYSREDGKLIRPMLNCSRTDIEAYCEENGLEPRIDHTNLEPIYTRNVVRLELIPYINEKMGGSIVDSLAVLSDIAKEDKDFIGGFVDDVMKGFRIEKVKESKAGEADKSGDKCIGRQTCIQDHNDCQGDVKRVSDVTDSGTPMGTEIGNPGPEPGNDFGSGEDVQGRCSDNREVQILSASLDREVLRGLHPAVRKRVVTRCFSEIGLFNDIGSVHLEAAEKLLLSDSTTGQLEFPHMYVMKCRYDRVIFEKVHETDTISYELECTIIDGAEEVSDVLKRLPDRRSTEVQYFDADLVGTVDNLAVRTRREGDVISPAGFSGTKKLKKYFIDRKIDKDRRDEIPLLCLGSRVLWIYGLEVNGKYMPGADSRRLIRARIRQISE